MEDSSETVPHSRRNPSALFLGIIAVILSIAVLKIAKSIILPFVISIALSVALMPVIHFLRARKVPALLSSLISLGLVFMGIFSAGSLVTVSLRSLTSKLPFYVDKFREYTVTIIDFAANHGIYIDRQMMLEQIDPGAVAGLLGKSANFVYVFLQYGTLIFFITLFTLIESARFSYKANRSFGHSNVFSETFRTVGKEIQRYIILKTLISLATGVFVWIFLRLYGVDFPLIWALLTFLLNFIPSIGSIVAGIPPVLIALVQFDTPFQSAGIVLLGFLTIQLLIGSYLDPRIMGESLNISTLVVFLSVVFWGWIWGPIGMLLAVPLVVCIKVALAHNERYRPWALMLEG